MQEFATKVDNVGETLGALGFNAFISELENIAKDLGFTLDPEGGPDTDLNMLGKAIAMYASGASYYVDSGSANSYVLARSGSMQPVRAYFDGMEVSFIAGNLNTGASTVNVSALGVKAIEKNGSPVVGGDIPAGETRLRYNDSTGAFDILSVPKPGSVVQSVMLEDLAVKAFNGTIPFDDTIPQITEGALFLTQSITPTKSTNIIRGRVSFNFSANLTESEAVGAIFQDATVNAIAAGIGAKVAVSGSWGNIEVLWEDVAGTTSAISYTFRAGTAGGAAITMNGQFNLRVFGGAMISSMLLEEIEV